MKWAKLLIVLLLIAAGGAGVWYYLIREPPKPPVVPTVTTVQRGDLKITVSATGAVEPEFTVEIKSKASGVVRAVRVEAGDRVNKGALLVEIDPLTEQRKLTQAVAQLRMAQAKRTATAMKLSHLRSKLKRDADLLKKGLIARDVYDDQRKELAVLTGELQVANAQILKDRSSHQEAKDRLAETKIRAPISGTILERLIQPGQVIASATSAASGGTTLLKIADLDHLFVRVKIDEADVTKLKAGQPAEITADALPDRSFGGKVRRVSPQGVVESNVTVFDVIVEVDAAARKVMRPMLTANIEILTAEAKGALLLPRAAVRGRGRRASVTMEGGAKRKVKLGLSSGKQVEVRSGLSEGEKIVVPGPGAAKVKAKRTGDPKKKRSATDPRSLRRVMGSGGRGGGGGKR